jgi:N-acetylglucosaminyldiphosphoundecaprenol N-acetyl-beta-D-mannosaminyltransferase
VWTNEQVTATTIVSGYAEPSVFAPAAPALLRKPARLPIALLGVAFDNVTIADTLDRIDLMVASRKPHYVVTANVDFCVQAMHDVELRRILFDAHLVLCDGTPLVWASRLFGNPLPERVAGADLVPLLIKRASQKGHRIFFLGGAPQVTEHAVQRLRGLHRDIVIAGHYSPPFRSLLEMDHDEIIERIRAAKPDLLFVSFGCPKAEKWMSMHYRKMGVPVAMGVGATIDFLAGNVRRAPNWMQHAGLEWAFRLAQEPGRLWKRYANDLHHIGWPLLSQLYLQRLRAIRVSTGSKPAITQSEPTCIRVTAAKRLDHATLAQDANIWSQLRSQNCLLDLSEVEFIDSTGLAALIQLHRDLQPCSLVLLAPSPTVRRILRRFQLEDFFGIAPTALEAREFFGSSPAPCRSAFAPVPPLLWTGEVTAANVEEVWATTRDGIEFLCNGGDKQPCIDLAELRFIDSSGVGLMLRARRYAESLGAELRFTNARGAVRNVLRMARLDNFLLHQ